MQIKKLLLNRSDFFRIFRTGEVIKKNKWSSRKHRGKFIEAFAKHIFKYLQMDHKQNGSNQFILSEMFRNMHVSCDSGNQHKGYGWWSVVRVVDF